jgi:hypothetical protein
MIGRNADNLLVSDTASHPNRHPSYSCLNGQRHVLNIPECCCASHLLVDRSTSCTTDTAYVLETIIKFMSASRHTRDSAYFGNADHSVRNVLSSYLLPELPYEVTVKLSMHTPGRNVADSVNFDARWRSFVAFTLRPLYFWVKILSLLGGPQKVSERFGDEET